MAYRGYHIFVGDLEMPYAPSELTVTIGSNNETVELINGNEINILKNPKLTEIEFEVELPRGRQYAFANTLVSSKTFTDYFEKLMVNKTPTQLVITRPNPFLRSSGIGGTVRDFESTVLTVTLEGYSMEENADNAYDIIVALKFKQYLQYGTSVTVKQTTVQTVTKPVSSSTSTKASYTRTVSKNKTYTVKKGDTLWGIARAYYGNGSKWKTLYEVNKTVIENTAKKYGKKSSSNGHWIYPGTKLVIPM